MDMFLRKLLYGRGDVRAVESLVRDKNATEISVDQVIKGVWVGNEAASQSCEWLRANRISVVVNATKHIPFHKCRDTQYPRYGYRVAVDDPGHGRSFMQEDNQIMFNALDSITRNIHFHRKRGENILINCHAGAQRSAIIAAAYITKYILYPDMVKNYLSTIPDKPVSLEQDLLWRRQSMERAIEIVVQNRPPAFYRGINANFRPALERWIQTWP